MVAYGRTPTVFAGAAISLLISSELAMADWNIQFGNWRGQSYMDQASGQFTHCAVAASYLSGDYLIFYLNWQGQFGISVLNQNWQLNSSDQYPISIEIDRYSPVAASALAISPTQAVASFQDAYTLFQQVRRGRTMKIRTGNGMLTSISLVQAAPCRESRTVSTPNWTAKPRKLGPVTNPFAERTPQQATMDRGTTPQSYGHERETCWRRPACPAIASCPTRSVPAHSLAWT